MGRTYVLWAEGEEGRLRIGVSDARFFLPPGVREIALIEACDIRMMRRWCERGAKLGWSVEAMREKCAPPAGA